MLKFGTAAMTGRCSPMGRSAAFAVDDGAAGCRGQPYRGRTRCEQAPILSPVAQQPVPVPELRPRPVETAQAACRLPPEMIDVGQLGAIHSEAGLPRAKA